MIKAGTNGKTASSRGLFLNTGNGPALQCIDIGHRDYVGVIDPDAAFWALVQKDKLAEAFNGGRLLEKYFKKRAAFLREMRRLRFGNNPTAVYFNPTERCNLNCKYCYIPERMRRGGVHMNQKKLFEAIAATKEVGNLTTVGAIEFARTVKEKGFDYFDLLNLVSESKENIKFDLKAATDERILNKEFADRLKVFDPQMMSTVIGVIGITGEVETLTSNRILDFAVQLEHYSLPYLQSIAQSGYVYNPDPTSPDFLDYKPKSDAEAKRSFKALTDPEFTTKASAEQLNRLNYSSASNFFEAVGENGSSKDLAKKEVFDFAQTLGDRVGPIYFEMLAKTRSASKCTRQDAIEDMAKVPQPLMENYLKAMEKTGAVEAFTSKDTTGFLADMCSKDTKFTTYGMEACKHYLTAVENSKMPDALMSKTFFEWTKSLRQTDKQEFLSALAYNKVGFELNERNIKELSDSTKLGCPPGFYLDLLSSGPKLFGLSDPKDRLGFASTLSSRIRQDAYNPSLPFYRAATEEFVSKNTDKLSGLERATLTESPEYTIKNGKNLATFLERRKNGAVQLSPFTNREIAPKIISENVMSASENVKITSDEAINMIVRGINGSRDKASEQLAKAKLAELFGEDIANRAYDSWKKSASPADVKRLATAYSEYNAKKDAASAGKVVGAFRDCLNGKDPVTTHQISDIINTLTPVINGDKLSIQKGERLVAYNSGKNDILRIKSNNTGCCAFLGGVNQYAGLGYATDDAVALINFTITNKVGTDMSDQPIYGAAICVFSKIDGKNALFVDSVEGGLLFRSALETQSGKVLDALKAFASDNGCEYLAFSTNPGNSTPISFVNGLQAAESDHLVQPLNTSQQYLEGLRGTEPQQAKVKLIEV